MHGHKRHDDTQATRFGSGSPGRGDRFGGAIHDAERLFPLGAGSGCEFRPLTSFRGNLEAPAFRADLPGARVLVCPQERAE